MLTPLIFTVPIVFLLESNCFTMCLLQIYSKVIQLYVYMYLFFFRFFSHIGYYRVLSALC